MSARRRIGGVALFFFVVLTSCATLRAQSRDALSMCLQRWNELAPGHGARADRAYVYALPGRFWIHLTHGAAGTFGPRSASHEVLLTCGVATAGSMEVVFMGAPYDDPLVDVAGRKPFVSAAGSTELLFERIDGRFQFSRAQPFDRRNLRRHNPAPH